jgi:hypothetical protein
MVAILVEDCPWIFNAHRLGFTLYQPWLKNARFHEFATDRAKYYRIDLSRKK